MLYVKSCIIICTAPEKAKAMYLDYNSWHLLFPATITGARLIDQRPGHLIIEVAHRTEGKVKNEITFANNGDVTTKEWKPRYDAVFVNRFHPHPAGTRYCVEGRIELKGMYGLLKIFLLPLVKRRVYKYVLLPMKTAAEEHDIEPGYHPEWMGV